jgi:general secretion pathway protein D
LPLPDANGQIGPVKLRNETIDQVLDLLEHWTGKVLLRPPSLPGGNYTLTLDEPVSQAEAVMAIETLLNLNGIAVTPLGTRFLKITALNLARTESPLYIEGPVSDLPPSGQIATKLFKPEFLRVSEFLPQISALLNPGLGAAPVLFEKSNTALVTDSVSNLQRVERLMQELDRPTLDHNVTKFYTLRSAKASDVVNQLHTLLAGPLQMQLGATTTFQPDDRTNQVVLISDPRQQAFFDDLIAKYDVAAQPNTHNDVIFLKNASAKDFATLLSQLVQGKNTAARAAGATEVHPVTNAAPAPNGNTNAAPLAVALAGADSTQEFSPFLTILPEERSNALIVAGTEQDIAQIRKLVDQIDVLLAQVRIEVVIAEVTLGDEATSGISALGLKIVNNKLVGFSGAGAGIAVTNGLLTKSSDGSTQLSADIAMVTTPRKNNTTILSVPTIITTHNKEANIFVGEQRPVISSYLNDASNTTGGAGYRSTVTSKDIGIELTVKPLIGNDGSVQLEITQEVNDVLGTILIDGNEQPRIGRRATKSFISVQSGETIVLGGLQRNSNSHNTNRLGPIPIIGDLLGSRHRENTRTDLVFFLRPYVLTNTPADNADALRRIDAGPQRDAVRSFLDKSNVAPPKETAPPRS